MRRTSVQGAFRTATQRAGITTTGVAIPPLRHAYATHRREAGVNPRLIQRSLGHTQRETTMLSLPLTHTGHPEASERLNALMHVLPDGFVHVRHVGVLHARCAIPPNTLRLLIVQARPIAGKPTRIVPPQPLVALCPTCGAPMRVIMRLWTSNRAFVDTGCKGRLGQETLGATRLVQCNGTRASSAHHQAAQDH